MKKQNYPVQDNLVLVEVDEILRKWNSISNGLSYVKIIKDLVFETQKVKNSGEEVIN